jgi:NADP-reducing hydrogenase subunit HndB
MKSLEDLKKLREEALKKVDMRESDHDYRIIVGMATCGIAAGARPVLNRLVEEAAKNNYSCTITQTGCNGMCGYEPIVEIFDKNNEKTTYIHVNADKAWEIINEHIGNGIILEKYTIEALEGKK